MPVVVRKARIPDDVVFLAPRQTLMRTCAAILLGPPFVAILTTTAQAKYIIAVLMGLMLLYVFFLGHRLGVEYWRSALVQTQLRIGRDELIRS